MPPSDSEIQTLLEEASRIAVVGLSPRPERPSHSVAGYLQSVGYTIIPVHPSGGTILGERVYPDLRAARNAGPIDLVNIFRRSSTIPGLVEACVAVRPTLVWMQVGVVHEESARQIEEAGIPVVMNRCLAVAHQQLGVQ